MALMIWGLSRLAIIFGWIPDVCLIPSGRRNCIRPFDTDVRQIFLEFINGNRALARNAQVVFHWEEPMLVGNTVSFSVQVYKSALFFGSFLVITYFKKYLNTSFSNVGVDNLTLLVMVTRSVSTSAKDQTKSPQLYKSVEQIQLKSTSSKQLSLFVKLERTTSTSVWVQSLSMEAPLSNNFYQANQKRRKRV